MARATTEPAIETWRDDGSTFSSAIMVDQDGVSFNIPSPDIPGRIWLGNLKGLFSVLTPSTLDYGYLGFVLEDTEPIKVLTGTGTTFPLPFSRFLDTLDSTGILPVDMTDM